MKSFLQMPLIVFALIVRTVYAQAGPVTVELLTGVQRLPAFQPLDLPPHNPARPWITAEGDHKFGFDKCDRLGFSIQTGEDPNDVYNKLFPFPLVRVVHSGPLEPLNDPGPLQSVVAVHYVYPAAEDFNHKPPREIRDWTWEVPVPL